MLRSVTVCAVLVGSLGANALAGPARPDLIEATVSVSQQGRTLRVNDVVRNRGAAAAPRSTTGYYLGRVRLGGRPVERLGPGAVAHGAATLMVPASIAPGVYRLLACADDRHRIAEANERNNCRAAAQVVRLAGGVAPTFAGLQAATTCIPGPAGGPLRSSSYRLTWRPATDNVTPSAAIVYEIYQAAAPDGEDFSSPTYTTPPGATSFVTPALPDNSTYYFVVRARDRAGNRDTNTIERAGRNLCV
jgi:hypothetical protein